MVAIRENVRELLKLGLIVCTCKSAILYATNAAMPLACTIISGLHLLLTGPDENADTNLIKISCFLPKKYFGNGKFTDSAFFNKHCTF